MSRLMTYDALIVGGGPGGLYAAWRLAHEGYSVVVCEEHAAIDGRGVYAIAGGEAVTARVAILACGASYALQRRFGLGLPRRYLHTAQRELPVRTLRDVEVHFGHDVAPGGFAWAVPVDRPDGPQVRIGAMSTRAAGDCYMRMCERIGASWGTSGDA